MAKKASDLFRVYQNVGDPTISTVSRKIQEKDGLYFKDIDGSGTVSEVNDWRLPPQQRAAAYVKLMTVDEKIGQLFISDWCKSYSQYQLSPGVVSRQCGAVCGLSHRRL